MAYCSATSEKRHGSIKSRQVPHCAVSGYIQGRVSTAAKKTSNNTMSSLCFLVLLLSTSWCLGEAFTAGAGSLGKREIGEKVNFNSTPGQQRK